MSASSTPAKLSAGTPLSTAAAHRPESAERSSGGDDRGDAATTAAAFSLAPTEGFAHRFDQAVHLDDLGDGRFRGMSDQAYWNVLGPYGGIVAALVMQALMRRDDRIGDPLSLTVNYAGALSAGPFDIETRLRRSNRTTQHWTVEIHQGDDPATRVAITATAVFAIRRDVWSRPEAVAPAARPADELARLPARSGYRWPLMYDIRYDTGLPYQGDRDDSRSVYWIKDHPSRPLDYPSLTSICDSAFPRIMVIRRKMTPVATVSMVIYFHGGAQSLAVDASEHLLMLTQGNVFEAGFSDQQASVWTRGGRLLATTHQVVWYKE